jgi:hypothetical protein
MVMTARFKVLAIAAVVAAGSSAVEKADLFAGFTG